MARTTLAAVVLALASVGSSAPSRRADVSVSNEKTSLTLLYQNNLNATDDVNHVGAILLDPLLLREAESGCQALGETLLSWDTFKAHSDDLNSQLAYLTYAHGLPEQQLFAIKGGAVETGHGFQKVAYMEADAVPIDGPIPVLCTQTSNESHPSNSVATASNQVTVSSEGNTFVGFRNQKSFRFLGIRFANPPKRFEYTSLYSGKGETINATGYGSTCAQGGSGKEDCLFLNIQTPFIPKAGSKENLRPVHFWIHGGGFTGGTGSDAWSDGGHLASREDIVTVNFNYRLSTLGFLAVPGTAVKGNYGIADQQVALEWTIKNIANFGGDPNRITINGGSAGACSVRVMLGSPQTIGKFQGAILMSHLGGGRSLGIDGNYATTYTSYLTLEEGFKTYGGLFKEANCSTGTMEAQIECLKKVDAATLVSLPTVARYVVVDGFYVNTPELVLSGRNKNTAHVPVISGITRDDGSSFTNYPKPPVSTQLEGIKQSLGISDYYARSIIDSGLFPYYDTGNVTLDSFNVSQRVSTDNQFRCIDQATMAAGVINDAFASGYYYQLDRTNGGYDPNGLGPPPVTPGYPLGNPNLPYFRVHGGDPDWMFGRLGPLRDGDDLLSTQISVGYFAEFIRSGQPNPKEAYMVARNYTWALDAMEKAGPWEAVKGVDGPIRILDAAPKTTNFVDKPQCAFLNYSISYYLD